MAAAEARAAWQRTANRCFVQEDAKRAPKLACCPSSSSSKPQIDAGHGDVSTGSEHPTVGFMPLNWNPSNSNLPPDTKWWLQLQPNIGHQKDFTCEQLHALEAELEALRAEELNRNLKLGRDLLPNTDYATPKNDRYWVPTSTKYDLEAKLPELKAVNSKTSQWAHRHKGMGEYWYREKELMDLELDPNQIDQLISEQSEKLFDTESHWIGSGKADPWWRTADKNELASLVAQKSLEHIENCDLPPPQSMHVRKGPFACLESFDQDGIFSSSVDRKAPWTCHTCGKLNGNQWGFGEKGHSLLGSDKLFSSSSICTETQQDCGSEPSKAQLLEALRHSQTRAREAESAAEQACSEKEHIIKLFFKQASHLFAYKQWLQLLQLENFCLHLKDKNKDQGFSWSLPRMPSKGGQWKKGKHKSNKGNRTSPSCNIAKYALAFAVGLGLAGAGLLLGWTMGWLFPMF